MNEQTEQALQVLAAKLGTTTEYLWQVLINQAKYDILISSIQMVFMAAIVITTIKLHIKFSKLNDRGDNEYYCNDGKIAGMIFAGIVSIIMIVLFLSGFNELISAIFNPEYWALRQIFHLAGK